LQPTDVPGIQKFEVAIGSAAVDIDLADVTSAFTQLVGM